jgi:outer membrane immunogenic protein
MFKKSWTFAIALAAGISVAGAASAQESKFEGFYVGGQAHYSIINVDVSVTGVGSADDDMDGFGGGGFVGFGGTNGSIYGSIEAEVGYDGAQWDESVSVSGVGSASLDVEAQLTYGVGFRAGAVVADNFLIYGRVGWVRTNVEAEAQVSIIGVGSASGSDDEDFDGLRIGGGVEGMFADNIGVRGEYTYTMYEDVDLGAGINVDPDQHLFRVGVSYYF